MVTSKGCTRPGTYITFIGSAMIEDNEERAKRGQEVADNLTLDQSRRSEKNSASSGYHLREIVHDGSRSILPRSYAK